MFNGYSTLGAVALRLIEDYNNPQPHSGRDGYAEFPPPQMRRDVRYTLEQAIEKVCYRHETIAASGSSPAYVWCWFEIEDGVARFRKGEYLLKPYWKSRGDFRHIPLDEAECREIMLQYGGGDFSIRKNLGSCERIMLEMGVEFGQRMLFRYTEHWWSHGEDSEPDCESELLYVEPASTDVVYLPIVHSLRTRHKPSSFSVQ